MLRIAKFILESFQVVWLLPKQLFYNTGIPACIWFLRREKNSHSKDVLFIDASEMGYMKDRVHRNLSDSDDEENKGDFHENGWGDIQKIAETYHNWRKGENYENEKQYRLFQNFEIAVAI
jgi:type I restriction enzyme M protein